MDSGKIINVIDNREDLESLIDAISKDPNRPIVVVYQHNTHGDNQLHLPSPLAQLKKVKNTSA